MNHQQIDRIHHILLTNALLYPVAFMALITAGFNGIRFDTYTEVAVVFHILPFGFIAACILLAAWELFTD